MSRRTAARLAWSMCAVSLASTALAILLQDWNRTSTGWERTS